MSDTPRFSISALDFAAIPAGEHPLAAVLRLNFQTGPDCLFSLSPSAGDPQVLDDATAAALLADLLRPGWADRARIMEPAVRGDILLRGFYLDRDTGLGLVEAGPWKVECLVLSTMVEGFRWNDMISRLDDVHRTIYPTT